MPYRFLTIESSNGIQIDHCVKKYKKKKKKIIIKKKKKKKKKNY